MKSIPANIIESVTYFGASPNYVIFVCEQAEKSCPRIWPFALQSFCWPFDDPAACEADEDTKLQKFRDVRDQIEHQIKEWLATLPNSFGTEAGEESGTES